MKSMIKIELKPLSVNKSYQWRKVKTKDLIDFHDDILKYIKYIWKDHFNYIEFNKKDLQLKLSIIFWYSNMWSDIDNWLKPFIDWLSMALWFNDNKIYELHVIKEKAEKDNEYIIFELEEFK